MGILVVLVFIMIMLKLPALLGATLFSLIIEDLILLAARLLGIMALVPSVLAGVMVMFPVRPT